MSMFSLTKSFTVWTPQNVSKQATILQHLAFEFVLLWLEKVLFPSACFLMMLLYLQYVDKDVTSALYFLIAIL